MASSNAELDILSNGPVVDRRERLQNTIDSLIKLRQDVIVSYCKLSGVSSFDKRDLETHSINAKQLRNFCQIMVDYTAMGHFEVYQRIIEGKERRVLVRVVVLAILVLTPGIWRVLSLVWRLIR